MSFLCQSGGSSPDPLANSQNGSVPSKTKERKSSTPRKALSITPGNAQAHEISMTTPTLQKIRGGSPSKIGENEASPWRIRITVQAEPDKLCDRGTVPQCSPSRVFAERTFTTIVPLKAGNEASPTSTKKGGIPKKPRERSKTGRSTSKSRKVAAAQPSAESPVKQRDVASSSTQKRGRGRPRTSIEPARAEFSGRRGERTSDSPHPSMSRNRNVLRSVEKGLQNQSEDTEREEPDPSEPIDEFREFDSVMESEGFSMVSVSSLSSAQSVSSSSKGSMRLGKVPSPSLSKRQVTPTNFQNSPVPPPPPKPTIAMRYDREIDKPTNGTPKLARVVRAGIALQGVLSPNHQRSGSRLSSSRIKSSSSLSSATSPRERLDDLFSGFGPETRRELRAGLRLGEELAKRQSLEPRPKPQEEHPEEDIFASDPEIRYPQLPADTTAHGYNLKVPTATSRASPSISNTQLPSPARSEVDANDDRMSWKYDTIPQRAAPFQNVQESSTNTDMLHGPSRSVDCTMMEREAEWQRERDAISKQIQQANSSQVIVINSDDEDVGSPEITLEDDGDIWQEEAQNSRTDHSSSDIPPIFRQTEAPKPRRSQLPSPWMRKCRDVLDSTINDSDLWWQPSQTEAEGKTSEAPIQLGNPNPGSSSLRSSGFDDDKPSVKTPSSVRNIGRQLDNEGSMTTQDENQSHNLLSQIEMAIRHDKKDIRDEPADASGEDVESDESYADDEYPESHLLSQQSMQNDSTGPLGGDTELDPDISTSSTIEAFEEDVPVPRTPSPLTPLSKIKTPKHVRFSTEKPRRYAASTESAGPSAPLPPAPTSWFSRVSSLLPTWSTTAPAAVPLPSRPKRTIRLSTFDQGPLPIYMPWTQSHWWALIRIIRQSQADPAAIPYTSTMACANYLGHVVTVNKWSKKITKQDCAVLQRFIEVLKVRGTHKGMETTFEKGGRKQWGKVPGQWMDMSVILSAVVSQWACDVQDGVCAVGWGDRAGIKAGSEKDIWTKADLPIDGPRVVYVV